MYFASRLQAGRMLAGQVTAKYADAPTVVVALSDGGVVVGSQIAIALKSALCLLLSDEIIMPREIVALAGITQNGAFSYNHAMSDGEIDEMVGEYRGSIEQQKLEKLSSMHRSMGSQQLIRDDLLSDRHIIFVSDGIQGGFALDLAQQYLRPISFRSLIVATPLADVPATDRMHILADDIFCMDVIEDYISTDHYYDTQDVPDHDTVVRTVAQIVSNY